MTRRRRSTYRSPVLDRILELVLRRRCWCGTRTRGLDPYCSGRCARVDRDHPTS